MSDIILINKKKSKYYYYFNKTNGLSIRAEYKGHDEPLWSLEGPELIDVSITNYCERNCEFCYRNSSVKGKHMSLKDFESILILMQKTHTYQIAIGGGNPNQHPDFVKILKMCREKYGIIPSYTTNGDGLTEKILDASKKYCGAVAISYYEPFNKFISALNKLKSRYIKTNIHFLMTSESIGTAIDWLENLPDFLNGVNAIIFLNYKPEGNKIKKSLLLKNSDKTKKFFEVVKKHDIRKFKLGFDSCSISGIVENLEFDSRFIEACESGRFSAFINENLNLYPCSFFEKKTKGIDLNKVELIEAWKNASQFKEIRDKIINNFCINKCKYEKHCKGGCPMFKEINLCRKYQKIRGQNDSDENNF